MILLLTRQWQPIPELIWQIDGPISRMVVEGVFWHGWLVAVASTFFINHLDLFGLEQVYLYLRGNNQAESAFRTPYLYKVVRHPMMVGLLIAFWAAPHMTLGHMLFAIGMTAFALIGIQMEERDLVRKFGEEYSAYQRRTAALVPFLIMKQRQYPRGIHSSANSLWM